jgi:hypothetical protein
MLRHQRLPAQVPDRANEYNENAEHDRETYADRHEVWSAPYHYIYYRRQWYQALRYAEPHDIVPRHARIDLMSSVCRLAYSP